MRSIPVSRVMLNAARALGVSFHVDGRAIDPLIVFGPASYMPLLTYYAESIAQDTMGWSLGTQLELDAQGVFGLRVGRAALEAEHFQGALTGLMYLRAAEVGFGWNENRKVDLHHVYARHAVILGALANSVRRERDVIGT